jgi:hypothetical protein
MLWAVVLCNTGMAWGQEPLTGQDSAAMMRSAYADFQRQTGPGILQRPLSVQSSEDRNDLRGEIQALIDQPFATTAMMLKESSAWCDILSLHLNVKYCRAAKAGSPQRLSVYVGRKFEQPLTDATPVTLHFSLQKPQADFVGVMLQAEQGPFGTHDYRILLEAIPAEKDRTFVRLSYAYQTSLAAKLAMQCYLGTIGSDKVGFSIVGWKPDGKPIYTGKMRGVMERNAMRYYLAVEAYLNTLSWPEDRRLDVRLQHWYDATERYPLQLHEIERGEYIAMKHREYARQAESTQEHQDVLSGNAPSRMIVTRHGP